jgi:hypothetical protein
MLRPLVMTIRFSSTLSAHQTLPNHPIGRAHTTTGEKPFRHDITERLINKPGCQSFAEAAHLLAERRVLVRPLTEASQRGSEQHNKRFFGSGSVLFRACWLFDGNSTSLFDLGSPNK